MKKISLFNVFLCFFFCGCASSSYHNIEHCSNQCGELISKTTTYTAKVLDDINISSNVIETPVNTTPSDQFKLQKERSECYKDCVARVKCEDIVKDDSKLDYKACLDQRLYNPNKN